MCTHTHAHTSSWYHSRLISGWYCARRSAYLLHLLIILLCKDVEAKKETIQIYSGTKIIFNH